MKTKKQKIESLKKEIEELKEKKEEDEEFEELLHQRNEMKFRKIYVLGGMIKKIGANLADWAEQKSETMGEDLIGEENEGDNTKKKKKSDEGVSVDLTDALFGDNEVTKQFK